MTVYSLATSWPEGGTRAEEAGERLNGAAYRAIVERARDIVTLIDAEGRFIYHNPVFHRTFGYARHQIIGHEAAPFLHPDDAEAALAVLAKVTVGEMAEGQVVLRFRHLDGSWRWIECYLSNEFDDPNIRAVMVVSREVTELRRIQEELRQVERVGKIGHWRWNVGDRRPYWSEGMYRLSGFERDEWDASQHWTRLIHPDDLPLMFEAHTKALRDGAPFQYQVRLTHRDGGTRVVMTQGHAERNEQGTVSTLLCVCQDITERVTAEEALRASEEQYRLLAANASDVIARFRPDEGLVYISPAISRLLGYEPEPLMGFGFAAAFWAPSEYQEFLQQIQRAASRGSVVITSRVRHADGSLKWIESTLHALSDHRTGRLSEVVMISRDVSERKDYELQLLTARDAAEAANRTKSLFLANMSHELRTPLNAIIGFSEVLKDQMFGPLGAPRYAEYARDIHDSGEHLLELINDILDMSKIEAGKFKLHFEDIDVEEVIETSIRLIELRAEEAGIAIDCMVGEEPVVVMADRRAVKQILLNLMANAVKFTPAGGRIMVSVECSGGRALLRVADTGIGIAAEHLPRLARPFEQIDTGDSRPTGTGLGLALVKALTELHGGNLRIDSRLGTGTVVTVDLPLQQNALATAGAGAP